MFHSALKMAKLVFILLCAFVIGIGGAVEKLEDISDENLHKSLETEQFVIVLFLDSKKCNEDCVAAEKVLVRIREDLVDAMGAWLTKTWDSPHLDEFGVDSTPAIVFFRNKNPMVYDGELDEDKMYEFFTQHKEKTYIRQLDDDSFEHQTQASTGATTGDWLVIFHTDQCTKCSGLLSKLEAVGATNSGRMNVAEVNRDQSGAKLGRRFKAYDDPTLILFHLGSMYRYTLPETDVKSLQKFAVRGYDLVPGEPVPQPKSAVDDTVEAVLQFCRENWILLAAIIASIVVFICALNYSLISESSKKKKKSSKKKK